MSTGTLMLAWLLAANPAPGDVYYLNQHQLRIPISVDPVRRVEIKELILFMSADEGKTWTKPAVVVDSPMISRKVAKGAKKGIDHREH